MKFQKIFFIVFILVSIKYFSQEKNESIVYIIDNIIIKNDPERGDELKNEDVSEMNVVKNKDSLKKYGFEKFDGAIYIFTKEYQKRNNDVKKIPSTKQMELKNGNVWYYKGQIYSGPFIDYYLSGKIEGEGILKNGKLEGIRKKYFQNGKLSLEREYSESISNGLEKEYYEDGSLKQKGIMKNNKEIGVWEMYFPNGQVKQRATFTEDHKNDESIAYYSNGKIFEHNTMVDGKVIKDKSLDEVKNLITKSQEEYKKENYKSALKYIDKAIALKPDYQNAYFIKGTMLLNEMKFDESLSNFDKAIEIEPYYEFALANRAFARIKKYELGNSKVIDNEQITVAISKRDIKISEDDLKMICNDLQQAIFLGDKNEMVLDANDKYCLKK